MAKIYVGTYAKYNDRNLFGKWLDLEDYVDKEDFLKACAELHSDEADPEFMFQDYEGFPKRFYCESHVGDEIWEWLELDEKDRDLLELYLDNVNQDGTIAEAREAFDGKHRNKEDWAAEFLDGTGFLEDVPVGLRNYIDYEAYARDMRQNGDVCFVEHEGEVWAFRTNC